MAENEVKYAVEVLEQHGSASFDGSTYFCEGCREVLGYESDEDFRPARLVAKHQARVLGSVALPHTEYEVRFSHNYDPNVGTPISEEDAKYIADNLDRPAITAWRRQVGDWEQM